MADKARVFVVNSERDVERLRDAVDLDGISVAHDFKGDPTLPWLAEQPPLRALHLWGAAIVPEALTGYPHRAALMTLSLGPGACGSVPWTELPGLEEMFLNTDDFGEVLGSAPPGLLRRLTVIDYSAPDFELLAAQSSLVSVEVGATRRLRSLRGLERLGALQELVVQATRSLTDFDSLPPSVAVLGLEGCRGLTRLDALTRCPQLEHLGLVDCGDIESLAPLAHLHALTSLLVIGDTNIVDGRVVDYLPQLSHRKGGLRPRSHYDGSLPGEDQG